MYNKIKLLVFLFCLSPCSILAQNIQVLMSPKPSPYISDWQQQTETLKLIISNPTTNDILVKLKTELFDGKGSLIGNTDDAKMQVITVSPGVSTYNAEDIIPSSAVNYKGGVSEKAIMQTGRIPDDNYKLCVALIDPQTSKPVGSSGTVCKIFTIVAYQAPTLISPTNKEIIKGAAIKGIVFRWSPVIPSPKTIVTYRLQVWEVLQGQNSMTALRSNMPIVEKDYKGILQTQWPIDFPLPDTGVTYVWTITPLDDEERKFVDGLGFSEPFEFRACCWPPPIPAPPIDPDIMLISPANKGENSADFTFSWNNSGVVPKSGYHLRVWEVISGQDNMIFEKDGISGTSFKYPATATKLETGKTYFWAVKGNAGFSEPFEFRACCWPPPISPPPIDPDIMLISPANNEEIKGDINFTWGDPHEVPGDGYTLRIVELKGDQSPEDAIAKNPAVFEQKGIMAKSFKLGDSVGKLKDGKNYVWQVNTREMKSEAWKFLRANHENEWPTAASANCYYCLKDEQPCLSGESECNLNPISVSHILGTDMEKTHFFTKYQMQNENLVRMIFEKTNTSISPELFEVVFGTGYYYIRENLRLTDWLQKELKMKKDFTIAEGKYPITQDGNLYVVDFPNMQYRATTAACSCKANLPVIETVMCSQQTNWPTAAQLQLSSSFGGSCSGISVVWNPTTPPGVSGTYTVTATRSGISCTRSVRVTILSPSLELCTKPSGLNGNQGCKKMVMLKATDSVCTPGKTKFPVGSKFRYFICRGLTSLLPPSCLALPTQSLPVGCFPTLATGNWYKMSNSTLSASLQIPDLAVNVGTENYWIVCCLELPNGCSGPTLYGPIAFHVNSPVNQLDLRVTSPSPYPADHYHQCCGKRFNLFNNSNSTVFNPNNNPVVYTYQWLIKKNNTLDNTPPHCLAEVTNTYPTANPDCPDNPLLIDNRWYKFGASTPSINAPALPASQPGYSYHVICYVRVSCDVGNKSSAFASAQTFRVEMPNATPIPIINGLHDVCIPSTVTLTGSGYPSTPAGITFSWTPNNGTNTTATFNPNPPQNFRNVRFTYTIPPSNGPGNPYTYGCIVTSDPYRVNFNNCGNTCDQNLVTTSNDRTSFLATVQNAQLIDFSSDYSATPAIPLPYGQAALNNWDWNGISFSDCQIYWTAYLVKGSPNPLTITFPPGLYKKAGFEMSEWIYRDGTNGIYTIKVTSGNCEYVYQVNGSIGQVNYFGVSLPNAIDKIQVSRDQVILRLDNFTFGN